MQISSRMSRCVIAAAVILTAFVGNAPATAGEIAPLVYDLQANGPATSFAEECRLDGSCYQYPILGTIGVILDSQRPSLLNIDSYVVTPFGAPINTLSEFAWQRLDWTIGEYLTDPQHSDLSMRFYPNPVLDTVQPLYELLVELTEGRSMLTLTGGGAGMAGVLQNVDSVAFSVSGRLVPEPNASLLAAAALMAGFASRRRR